MEETLKSIKNFLTENNLTISTGESCTGGLICSYLTDIDGASNFIEQCFVTYAPQAKERFLHVNPKTIEKYTVVSKEVAHEMAQGLLDYADVSVATTGYASPPEDKTLAGLVFIGLGLRKRDKVIIKTVQYQSKLNQRTETKKDFATAALKELLKFLIKEL